ncbi:hypothetical protein JCM10908_001716 [Rhodotorula pacifica]|uniref:uncharacterized protein n=1 Tax=Rhodotorula pacifica TaxID=1495444 RepID=UPI003181F87D
MASETTPLLYSGSGHAATSSSAGGSAAVPRFGSNAPPTQATKHCPRFYEEDEVLKACNVFGNVHRVYGMIEEYVDIPLSDEQMRGPEIQFAIIQPLEAALAEQNDISIVYVLLLCRLQFIRERDSALASSSLNETRAHLCELLAIKLLRHQAAVVKGAGQGLLAMARALVGGFHAFQGASEEVLERIRQREGYGSRVAAEGMGRTNALELAILGKARTFIKSQATQRVIGAIFDGRITYSSSSFIDILGDKWKSKQIELYDVHKTPLLDHYRLRVPKYRSMIELGNFLVLFASFLLVILDRHSRYEHIPVSRLSAIEIFFFVYSVGYSVDKLASIAEHGWSVYAAGLTNGLDAASVPIYIAAFVLRAHSVITNDARASDRAYAILSTAACLLFPRLAFATISNNLLILSLRAMLAEFLYLFGITVFCFIGFVFALNHLSEGDYSVTRISEWLIFIFFGLDGSGIDESPKFDPVLGPILFIAFAALSNTLLTSVLVAILSTTYASIASDAAAEDMFRKAVACFEGVKGNSLFDYLPPLNLIALFVMWPLSHFLTPRWFHKVNVFATRTLSLPILLLIALYERQSATGSFITEWFTRTKVALTAKLPRQWADKLSLLEGAHWECEAVFEYTPSGDEKSSTDEDDFDDTDDESALGPDEVDEAVRRATETMRYGNRASAVIDGNRVPGAIQRVASSSSAPGGSPPSGLLQIQKQRLDGSATPSSPMPLSRQPSYAAAAETSTIRAASRSRPSNLTHSKLISPTSPVEPEGVPPPVSVSDAAHAALASSPPSSPRTHFAPPPRPRTTGLELKRARTMEERLPANARGGAQHRRRRSSMSYAPRSDGSESSFRGADFLGTSAPTRDSPLARLYHVQAGEDDAQQRVGALRRRMSLGPNTAGARHGRQLSEGAVGVRRVNGTSPSSEPSTAQLLDMVQGLIATVNRLEAKIDEDRQRRQTVHDGDSHNGEESNSDDEYSSPPFEDD